MVNPNKSDREKTLGLLAAGAALLILGYAWGFQFPIIKKLWTSSYVLVAAGWSAWLLAGFFWVIDVKGWRRWAEPFIWIGMNSIALYLIAHVVDFGQLASRLVGGPISAFLDTHVTAGLGGAVVSLVSILLCVALARLMYVQKLFIRL
jgi:predicted acyltransferase